MNKITLKIRAVIFDMDGVITNTMPDHFRAWKEVLKAEGVRVNYLDVYGREGQRGITSIQEILAAHGRKLPRSQAQIILDKKEKLFKKIVQIRFVSGARNFIRDLDRAGLTLGLVTGTAHHEMLRILPENVRKHFKLLITGTDVKIGKPHPEPYLLALKRLKITAKDAVVIENAPFGIQSAKAAGIKCLALETSLPRKYLKEADHIFSSIHKMRVKVNFQSK